MYSSRVTGDWYVNWIEHKLFSELTPSTQRWSMWTRSCLRPIGTTKQWRLSILALIQLQTKDHSTGFDTISQMELFSHTSAWCQVGHCFHTFVSELKNVKWTFNIIWIPNRYRVLRRLRLPCWRNPLQKQIGFEKWSGCEWICGNWRHTKV